MNAIAWFAGLATAGRIKIEDSVKADRRPDQWVDYFDGSEWRTRCCRWDGEKYVEVKVK